MRKVRFAGVLAAGLMFIAETLTVLVGCTTTSRGTTSTPLPTTTSNAQQSSPTATLNPTNTWTYSPTPPATTPTAWATPAGGCIVVIGGNQAGTTSLNDVYVSSIASNGTLGSWSSQSNTIPTPIPIANWATSGMWAINSGGSSPYFIYGNSAEPSGTNYAFLNGLASAPVTSCSVGPWSNGTPMANAQATPILASWLNCVTDQTFAYLVESASGVSYCESGQIAGGSIVNWQNQSAIGIALDDSPIVQARGYLFAIGGRIAGTTPISTIYRAQVSSPGTVGAWSSIGNFPSPWQHAPHQAVSVWTTNATFIYMCGGDDGSTTQNSVYFTSVDFAGNLSSWTFTTPLPIPVQYSQIVAYRRSNVTYLAILGGTNITTDVSSVYYAQVTSNGALGAWTSGPALPSTRSMHAGVVF